MYQLILDSNDVFLLGGAIPKRIPADITNADWIDYQAWLVAGNISEPAQPLTNEEAEQRTARPAAKQWLLDHQAAIDFMRLTPAEQKTAIDGMSTAAKDTVLWYLAVVVSALVKERYL